jgi:hypothetical protein
MSVVSVRVEVYCRQKCRQKASAGTKIGFRYRDWVPTVTLLWERKMP